MSVTLTVTGESMASVMQELKRFVQMDAIQFPSVQTQGYCAPDLSMSIDPTTGDLVEDVPPIEKRKRAPKVTNAIVNGPVGVDTLGLRLPRGTTQEKLEAQIDKKINFEEKTKKKPVEPIDPEPEVLPPEEKDRFGAGEELLPAVEKDPYDEFNDTPVDTPNTLAEIQALSPKRVKAEAQSAQPLTLEQMMQAFKTWMQTNPGDAYLKLLGRFGVKKLIDLPSDQYPMLMRTLRT